MKVAYLGPELTFTHLASQKKFGSSAKYVSCDSITDVFTEVEEKRCDYGVVPIENSIEGAVNHTLDMFIDSKLNITSEVYLEISHCLLMPRPVGRSPRIDKVYSNPQVFGQCRSWLRKNLPNAELVEVSSTAKAAKMLSKQRNAACIASSLVAEKYNLERISHRPIEDSPHNVTRFLVIGKKSLPEPTGNDKTSIVFSIKDKIGALHDILVPFKENRINLTKIESRPSKLKAWEYYFFVDLEGHCKDENVKKALDELEEECAYLNVLGSYPKGEEV